MKKILVVNTKYKTFGGEDSNIIDELAYLKNFFNVDYLEFDNGESLKVFDYLSLIFRSNLKSNKLLIDKLNKFNPDVVYVHNTWFKANLGIFRVLQDTRKPTILKIHNFRFDCTKTFLLRKHLNGHTHCPKCGLSEKKGKFFNKYFPESLIKSLIVNWYGRKYFNILQNSTIKIFVLNKFHKDYLENLGVSESRIFISKNPINIENNNYDSDSNYITYAGSLTSEKGISELLFAWKESNIKLNLLIIGTGKIDLKLKKTYSSKNIKFMGSLNHEEVLNYIKKSRAVITATKMYEGQPRLLCEASSFGVPSIYPSFGGMDEYFPPKYEFSFKQFDSSDLQSKIKKLNDKKLLKNESSRVYFHLNKTLDQSKIFESFEKVLDSIA
ncbi:glycosyltransferase [Acidimicrobiia bacterium]|nr:glycosyltransferase [Acidimicrobiia bacterium]